MLKIKSNRLPIHNFTIFCERHSGSKFLIDYISQLYLDYNEQSSLPVTWEYGWKHWFGFNSEQITQSHNTLFISIVRNPYNWLKAMYRMPHHLRAWDGNMSNNPFISMEDFLLSEVKSYHKNQELDYDCSFGCDHHMLEKRRYKNIFELREIKNLYLLETMPKICHNYILVNYETLCTDIKQFIDILNQNFNLKFLEFKPNICSKKDYKIDNSLLPLINSHLNWQTENRLNYFIMN